jgi:hypothetical protein
MPDRDQRARAGQAGDISRNADTTTVNRAAEISAVIRPKIPATIVAPGIVSLLNDIGGDAVSPLLPAFIATIGILSCRNQIDTIESIWPSSNCTNTRSDSVLTDETRRGPLRSLS